MLGILLVIYAAIALTRFQFHVAKKDEKWVDGICGLLSGLISAATGVQAIPSIPFLQAIGLERDELIQALGVFFTTATVAMVFNLTNAGLLGVAVALPAVSRSSRHLPACISARFYASAWSRKHFAAGS